MKVQILASAVWTFCLVGQSLSRVVHDPLFSFSKSSQPADGDNAYITRNESLARSFSLDPVWNFDQAFVFKGEWFENEEDYVRYCLFGVDDLAVTTAQRLAEIDPQNIQNEEPSFTRYFWLGDLDRVRMVFENISKHQHDFTEYRSFYSMKMKDGNWKPRNLPLYNVDSYTSLARELYYKAAFQRAIPWNDAVDPISLGDIAGPS